MCDGPSHTAGSSDARGDDKGSAAIPVEAARKGPP